MFLDTSPTLEGFRKAKHTSYNISNQGRSLLIGQNNEHRCIEWLMKNNKEAQNIFFNGTGRSNNQTLIAKIPVSSDYVFIQCRPDLILSRGENTILFEFKAVKSSNYLYFPEYDSVHAQIWCYRFIENIKIDSYYLLRYFENPFMWGVYPQIKKMTINELSDVKFTPIFEKYLSVVKALNCASKIEFDFENLNRPVNQPDKCHNCLYYRLYCEPKCKSF